MTPPTHVVGIGASAGGLNALRALVANLPRTGRMAYVVAQHMAADAHAELMVTLLGRDSTLEVHQAREGTLLESDCVYILPAGQDGIVQGGAVRVQPSAPGSLSHPSVDVLLESVALALGKRGVGIILSGTGSDGVRGCRAIQGRGGLALAQAPESARFSGMPEAAMRAGVISETLPPERMGERLGRLFPDLWACVPEPPPPEPGLPRLLRQVREATGIDFSGYKEETLLRRLTARLNSLGLDSLDRYAHHVTAHPQELEALAQHFLVSLSSFFRDRSSFEAVNGALRGLLARRPPGEPLRIWVPGCATGEECYTLAILVAQILGPEPGVPTARILGTDLNPRALAQAQGGLYPESAFKEMDPDLLCPYFRQRGASFEVNGRLRAMCEFARHDVLQEEFQRDLDMISCRNFLIYLQSDSQARLMCRFHAALRPDGLLFIGQSETVGIAGHALFRPLDAEHRLYQRRTT